MIPAEEAGAALIDGKGIAADLRGRIRTEVGDRVAAGLRVPGLATILVGDDAASRIYVGRKRREAAETGMLSEHCELPASVSMDDLLSAIGSYNDRDEIDGIIVQLPLPDHLDQDLAIAAVDPAKDVDGLHPLNQGALFTGRPGLRPCTPISCIHLVETTGVDPSGLHAAVIGRSALVGKPVAMLLLERHATVVLCHSRTPNLGDQVATADIVVAAVGSPSLVRGEWIKPGAVVIDVGINRVDGRLVGDVEFEAARRRAGHITPVPGGVGPMTVAMLLSNTLEACRAREEGRSPAS
ncbi:MAG: bifunctional methylenetetrahydrofolate dehydrogenase/methenyltetrahydrofolate cyclohydrolase FolD [Candidatus Binatia bacterium]